MKKRTIPSNFYKDPEGMYMDLQELRQEMALLRKENQNLKTLAQKSEADSIRKQKQVEELLRAHALVETKGTRYENLFKEVNVSLFCIHLRQPIENVNPLLTCSDNPAQMFSVLNNSFKKAGEKSQIQNSRIRKGSKRERHRIPKNQA